MACGEASPALPGPLPPFGLSGAGGSSSILPARSMGDVFYGRELRACDVLVNRSQYLLDGI